MAVLVGQRGPVDQNVIDFGHGGAGVGELEQRALGIPATVPNRGVKKIPRVTITVRHAMVQMLKVVALYELDTLVPQAHVVPVSGEISALRVVHRTVEKNR